MIFSTIDKTFTSIFGRCRMHFFSPSFTFHATSCSRSDYHRANRSCSCRLSVGPELVTEIEVMQRRLEKSMQDKCSASNEMSSLQHMQSAEDGESELKSASSRLVQSSTKGGPVLLCTTQAEPVRIFSQPRARLIVVSCSCTL